MISFTFAFAAHKKNVMILIMKFKTITRGHLDHPHALGHQQVDDVPFTVLFHYTTLFNIFKFLISFLDLTKDIMNEIWFKL